jgi:hypothetical protein
MMLQKVALQEASTGIGKPSRRGGSSSPSKSGSDSTSISANLAIGTSVGAVMLVSLPRGGGRGLDSVSGRWRPGEPAVRLPQQAVPVFARVPR